MLPAGCEQGRPFRLRPLAVDGRIERRSVRIARPCPAFRFEGTDNGPGFATAEKGGIGKIRLDQPVQRHPVIIEMLRLSPHWLFPREFQPAEIIIDRLFQLRRAARLVYILYTQQKAAAIVQRHVMVQECGKRMAEMQRAVGAWRETVNRFLTDG